MQKITHFMYVPWTGLGKYNGFRGNRWLKNRIKVFKQFVIPSLQAQTSKNFVLWCSWRPEEKGNKHVSELMQWLDGIKEFKTVHTFHGVCFYDDKYEDAIARERLTNSLHYSIGELYDVIGESDYILMTIQPSDDLYHKEAVWKIQRKFEYDSSLQGIGFKKGYIINYWTKEVAEYNPTTNPPFYTIKFTREQFTNPLRHLEYTALKHDVGKYKKGTPLPSHEYVGDCVKYLQIDERGFMVGTHLENISTTWQIPFKGEKVNSEIVKDFGIGDISPIRMSVPARKRFYFSLPYKAQRKIRYWLTEKFVFKFKNPLKRLWFWRNYTTNQHAKWWKNRKIDWRKDYLSTWNHPHRQGLVSVLAQIPWGCLFEIGCGAGANLVQIAIQMRDRVISSKNGSQIGGSDINPDAIAVANTNGFFAGGAFNVCPADDVMMSDKSSDVILTDMLLIYVGKDKIKKHLQEFKRIARNYVVFSEFDSTSWFERVKLKLSTGYSAHDFKKLLLDNGFYDIVKYKYKPEHWPNDSTHQKFATIIIAKVPKH